MLRVLIFGFACVVVLVGLSTAMPILEDGMEFGQFATSAYPYSVEEVPPSCVISSNPQVITAGEEASIAWTSKNASAAELSPSFGAVPVEGGMFITPAFSEVYTLTVYSPGRVTQCSTYITVQ